MPAAKTTDVLMSKLGQRFKTIYDETKGNEVKMDTGGGLPPNIENGIAKVTELKIDVFKNGDNTGQPYFYAHASIVFPETAPDGTPLLGRLTRIGPEPICDTPKSQGKRKTAKEHWDHVRNELGKLGLDLSVIPAESIEAAMAALKDSGIYTRFRTWQGKATKEFPNPKVNEVWGGVVPNYVEGTAGEIAPGATDDTTDGAATQEAPAGAPAPFSGDVSGDLDALLERANAGDVDAVNDLNDLAIKAGHSAEEVNAAPNWEAVVEMIRNPAGGAEGENAAGEWAPAVDEEYGYSPPNPKKKGEKLAKTNVKITAVDSDKRTVNLSNVKNPKVTYKGVSWDDLESAD